MNGNAEDKGSVKSNTRRKVTATVFIMAAVTVIAKLLGLVRDILFAGAYGTGTDSIAYETAARLPLLLFDFVIGGVITAAFIPVFSEINEKRSRTEALRFASDYFNLVFAVTLILTLIGEAAAPLLCRMMAPDISSTAASEAVQLTRIMFPVVIFAGMTYSFVGLLQSLGSFRLPAVISLFSNGVTVVYLLFLAPKYGVSGLAVSMVIGWALQAAVQLPTALRMGYRPRLSLGISPDVRRAATAFLPVLICSWLLPVTNIINTRFASGISGGSAVTAVGYANRLYFIIVGVFSFIATNLLFPYLSRASAKGEESEAKGIAAASLKLLFAVILPITAGTFALALPIIRLLFMRGAFSAGDAEMTATALRWFTVGMPGMALNEVLLKLFFSRRETKMPMLVSLAGTVIDFFICMALSALAGVAGIALACSITVTLCAAANYAYDAKRHGALLSLRDAADTVRLAVPAVLCGAAAYGAFCLLSTRLPEWAALAAAVLCGAVVYLVPALAFPIPELAAVLGKKRK